MQPGVTLRDLVLAEPETRLDSFMVREVITLTLDMSSDDVADEFTHYDLVAMPVVDDDGRLLGIVTVDDAIDVLQPNEWRPRIPRIFH